LPLRTPFRAAHGTRAVREALLVRVVTPASEGWGECVAPEEPTYTEEYLDGAQDVITRHLVPLLASWDGGDPAGITGALARVRGHRMAKASLEAAVLDAALREAGRSLASFLGGVRSLVPAGVAVGIAPSLSALVDEVGAYLACGYRQVKLKIAPGWDVAPVRAVREQFAADLELLVDANGAYHRADAAVLAALDVFGLTMIEQPLAPDDLVGHAELARSIRTPVCLDESVTSAAVVETAVRLGACRFVSVKAARVGGLLEARRVHDVCVAAGVGVRCGGMLETGVGRAASLALASLPGFDGPGDLSASSRYFATDVTDAFELESGALRVPGGPGIGVEPLAEALAALAVGRWWVAVGDH
ncbi:MAG: o-succinylbenzoate synthase, partial [Acidimicrobiia bacterium]